MSGKEISLLTIVNDPLAWIFHEDSASRGNLAKQVGQSSEKRGSLTYQKGAEEDGLRCDAKFSLAWNRHTAILKRCQKSDIELYTLRFDNIYLSPYE